MIFQHDSTTFSVDVTSAQNFLSHFVSSAFINSKDKSMPTKNQLPTLSKLYSIYEEVPEDLLDEADIDSYFYHSSLNITKKKSSCSSQQNIEQKILQPQSFSIRLLHNTTKRFLERRNYFDKTRIANSSGLFERFLTRFRSS